MDTKKFLSAVVKDAAPDVEEERGEGEEKMDEAPEGLKAAAEDILAAIGQDYGSSENADKGQRQAFEDKRDRLCAALCSFLDQHRSE